MENLLEYTLIAQNQPAAPANGGKPGANPTCGGEGLGMMPFFVGVVVLFYFFIMRPQSRERAKRSEMLSQLKKNDKVVTIGGIIGTVASVHAETDEVVIKVDESTNTKLRMLRSSIHQVVTEEPEGEKSSQ